MDKTATRQQVGLREVRAEMKLDVDRYGLPFVMSLVTSAALWAHALRRRRE